MGHYLFRNGAQYIGNYRRGMRHGFGKLIYPDHSCYEGDWLCNVRHGRGKYTYKNGDYYDGEWAMNKRHGLGMYYSVAAQCMVQSVWQNGRRSGPSEITTSDYKFYGTWTNEQIQDGEGVFALPGEIMCDGYFEYNAADPRKPPTWITTHLRAYDTNRKPQLPGDFIESVGITQPEGASALRTVSDVDIATDYMVDRTIVIADMNDTAVGLIENVFTADELRGITHSLLDRAVRYIDASERIISGTRSEDSTHPNSLASLQPNSVTSVQATSVASLQHLQ